MSQIGSSGGMVVVVVVGGIGRSVAVSGDVGVVQISVVCYKIV